jgi:hypothetical protein
VQETPVFDLVIEDPLVVWRGLCELADVVSYAPGYARNGDSDTDALLERMILAETGAIQRETGREFIAIFPAIATRRFDIAPWHERSRTIEVGSLTTASTVKVIDLDQTTEVETVSSSDYVALPRIRQASEAITHLWFPSGSPAPASILAGYVLEVAGTWGYPSVPDDIREACAKIVVFRYATDAAVAGTRLAESLADVNVGALFASGRTVVESYIRPRVG